MVVFGSVVVSTLYVTVLERWHASLANYGFVIIPLSPSSSPPGCWTRKITPGLVNGSGLVLAGVYVRALRPAITPA